MVRNPNRSSVVSPSASFRTEVHRHQIPAKKASDSPFLQVNHTGRDFPSGRRSGSENTVSVNRQRCATPSYRFHHIEVGLRMHVVTDRNGCPLDFFMTAGQISDYTGATALLDRLHQSNGGWQTEAMTLTGSGRPWRRKGSNPVFLVENLAENRSNTTGGNTKDAGVFKQVFVSFSLVRPCGKSRKANNIL